jgi:cobalt-zinc-cadmium efflux system membrane fusion protein
MEPSVESKELDVETPIAPVNRARGPWIAGALAVGLLIGAGIMWAIPRDVPASEAEAQKPDLPPGVVEIDPAAQKNAGVQVSRAESRVLPSTLSVTGTVTPVESKLAHLRPLARGVIEVISVSLGARVSVGQPLLTYDNIAMGELTGEYLSERAGLRQTETDLEVKQRGVERAEALIKLEAISQQDVELRRSEVRNAQSAVSSARARVTRIEEQLHRFGLSDADLSRLTPEEGQSGHRTASHSVLRAPIGGVITKFDVASGEVVEPERELFTIADLSTVWVLADVYQKDLARLPQSADVEIRVDAYPDRIFSGKLTYISDVIDPKTRTAKVRCVVANPDGLLKLDLFATVVIPTNERRQAVVVPVAAVQQIDNQPVVFVRKSASQFERRKITVGQTAGGVIEILDGIRAGDEVVGDGSFYMKTALLRERIGGGE